MTMTNYLRWPSRNIESYYGSGSSSSIYSLSDWDLNERLPRDWTWEPHCFYLWSDVMQSSKWFMGATWGLLVFYLWRVFTADITSHVFLVFSDLEFKLDIIKVQNCAWFECINSTQVKKLICLAGTEGYRFISRQSGKWWLAPRHWSLLLCRAWLLPID